MMPNRRHADSSYYPTWAGFIFIFNLIVGTGALTLPAVFANAGYLLSLISIIFLAVMSFITATFVIEAIACANSIKNWQQLQFISENLVENNDMESLLPKAHDSYNGSASSTRSRNYNPSEDSDLEHLSSFMTEQNHNRVYYHLDDKCELGEMAALFFNDIFRVLFYICMGIYLYGDLSIYSAAIAKSLRDISCDAANDTSPANITRLNFADSDIDDFKKACWKKHTVSRSHVYQLFLIGFTLLFGIFSVFSVQKTKYLQILTVLFRWLAFLFMIAIAVKSLLIDGPRGNPPLASVHGTPSLFGACVYSFMCHHSLPSLLSPIKDKSNIHKILSYDYVLICLFYIVLSLTGIFAFKHIEDLYTLNFMPPQSLRNGHFQSQLLMVIGYFLALFPVFTLSASYPIIAITLRNNLQALFLDMSNFDSYNYFIRRMLFPLLVVLPPFVITYFTENITSLVTFTGSYAGVLIQYLIPTALVYYARRTCTELLGNGVKNKFQSGFLNKYWLLFVIVWALSCLCLVTVNFLVT